MNRFIIEFEDRLIDYVYRRFTQKYLQSPMCIAGGLHRNIYSPIYTELFSTPDITFPVLW